MDTAPTPIIPLAFLFIVVFTLSLSLVNLLLAVVLESYEKDDTEFTVIQKKVLEKDKKLLRKKIAKNQKLRSHLP